MASAFKTSQWKRFIVGAKAVYVFKFRNVCLDVKYLAESVEKKLHHKRDEF